MIGCFWNLIRKSDFDMIRLRVNRVSYFLQQMFGRSISMLYHSISLVTELSLCICTYWKIVDFPKYKRKYNLTWTRIAILIIVKGIFSPTLELSYLWRLPLWTWNHLTSFCKGIKLVSSVSIGVICSNRWQWRNVFCHVLLSYMLCGCRTSKKLVVFIHVSHHKWLIAWTNCTCFKYIVNGCCSEVLFSKFLMVNECL